MAATTAATTKVTLATLIAEGKVEAGTVLNATFKDRKHLAKVTEDGKVKVGRKAYGSLSAAAKAVRADAGGADRYVSGWTFWTLPDGRKVDELR